MVLFTTTHWHASIPVPATALQEESIQKWTLFFLGFISKIHTMVSRHHCNEHSKDQRSRSSHHHRWQVLFFLPVGRKESRRPAIILLVDSFGGAQE
jgi:hypothetical protein